MRDHGPDVREAARGKWRGLLMRFGLDECYLKDKHGPCPLCMDGVDRYRWDNKEGKGTYYCSKCGAGDGWTLLMKMKGWDFAAAANEVRQVLGLVQQEAPQEKVEAEKVRATMQRVWRSGARAQPGDLVDRYLTNRGVGLRVYPASLRLVSECWYEKVGQVNIMHPAMVAAIQRPDEGGEVGRIVNLHRTFLTPEGIKVEGEAKKVFPAPLPPGSAIRLFTPGPILGVAEGIENALAAHRIWGVPVWALVNSANMASWEPPPEVRDLLIFGDNDRGFAGQAAAYALGKRMAARKGMTVEVLIPPRIGYDWNDELLEKGPDQCLLTSPSPLALSSPPSFPSSTTPGTVPPGTMLH